MPTTFFGLFLLALCYPVVLRINKWIEGKKIDAMNDRRINKQLKEAAITCKQHLRLTNPNRLALVERFIIEIEGSNTNPEYSQWGLFRDKKDEYKEINDIRGKMLDKVDSCFVQWATENSLATSDNIIPPPPKPNKQIRISKNGEDLGEYSMSAVKQMVTNGLISLEDHYYDNELNKWIEIKWNLELRRTDI